MRIPNFLFVKKYVFEKYFEHCDPGKFSRSKPYVLYRRLKRTIRYSIKIK